MAAVVLFSLSFTDWSDNGLIKKDILSPDQVLNELLNEDGEEEIVEKGLAAGGFNQMTLGGPVLTQNGFLGNAQAAIDFSADDDLEGGNFCLIEDTSLMAPLSPDPECYFDQDQKKIRTYTVRFGDTPESIALAHNINTYTLLWANNLKDGDIIKPGQELTILPINGVRVKVGSGDNIEALAKKYSADVKEIIAYNALPADGTLRAGDYLILPGGEMPVSVSNVKSYTYSAPKFVQSSTVAGWLIMPTSGINWGRLHNYNAVDIASKCGTPVYAAAAGTVILADGVGWNGGYGKYIKLSHSNGVVTLYAHLSRIVADSGSVKQGELIGYMGTTGRSTGCHLHFEVRGAKNPFIK